MNPLVGVEEWLYLSFSPLLSYFGWLVVVSAFVWENNLQLQEKKPHYFQLCYHSLKKCMLC